MKGVLPTVISPVPPSFSLRFLAVAVKPVTEVLFCRHLPSIRNSMHGGAAAMATSGVVEKRPPVFTTIDKLRPDTSGHNLVVKVTGALNAPSGKQADYPTAQTLIPHFDNLSNISVLGMNSS